MEVDINLVRPSPFQPRIKFDIEDLKQEIQKDGLLSTLIVRKDGDHYELIDGERRLRALRELGWKKIPVEVRQLDDRLAKLSIWKLNTVREDYNVEERARYFQKLAESGMTAYRIGLELSTDDNWVRAHLNVFRFPEEIQNAVWAGELPLATIRELEPIINANIEEATKLAREAINRRSKSDEVRKIVTERYSKDIENARVKAAQEALGAAAPMSLKLEEPYELERAAKALLKEAKQKREKALTPAEKKELERKREIKKQNLEKGRRVLEERIRTKVEREVAQKSVRELVKRPEVIRELVKRPEIREVLQQGLRQDVEPSRKGEAPTQKQGYLTLEESLATQYQHQREWNLKQLVGRDLSRTGKSFQFDFLTIGYSQKTVEDFVNSLKLARARILIDVRRKPQSMYKPEFNKDNLSKELSARGIEYIHMPELGIPRELRDEVYEGTTTAKVILDQYEKDVLKNGGLRNIQERVKGKGTFVIMCTEVDPTNCHRHKIAEALVDEGMVGYDL
jgi:ParB family chromosome partitioning protein